MPKFLQEAKGSHQRAPLAGAVGGLAGLVGTDTMSNFFKTLQVPRSQEKANDPERLTACKRPGWEITMVIRKKMHIDGRQRQRRNP